MATDLHDLSITELSRLIAARKLSPVELVEALIRRVEQYVSFWQKPSPLTAWNVTGQPVLALPNGFGRSGLPLGMQVLGRPFGETTILRVGHAYEQATEWHTRRPGLGPGAEAPAVTPPPVLSGTADQVDAGTRDLCVKAARRAGLRLDDLMLAQLLEGAPYALGMAERLRRDHGLHHEPANIFSVPASWLGDARPG